MHTERSAPSGAALPDGAATAADGDDARAVFTRWTEPARLPMARLASRLAPHADPDDIVQDALTRAWQKRAQYDAARGSAVTWLLAIVADQARSSRRRRNRWLRIVDDSAEVPDSTSSDTHPDIDLERAIGALAERQQFAIQLHYYVGLTVDETAAVMGCSVGTVKSTLFDARSRLRRLLGDTGSGDNNE